MIDMAGVVCVLFEHIRGWEKYLGEDFVEPLAVPHAHNSHTEVTKLDKIFRELRMMDQQTLSVHTPGLSQLVQNL